MSGAAPGAAGPCGPGQHPWNIRAVAVLPDPGLTSHLDIVDVHVALAAAERGHAVLTSDDADIAGVNPGLVLVHV